MPTNLYRKELRFWSEHPYGLYYWKDFDFDNFKHIRIKKKTNKKGTSFADVVIMADTETSRKEDDSGECHICAWSIAFRAYHHNLCTLYGRDPRELVEMFERLRGVLDCDEIYVYWHNLSYDHVFTRKFMFERFGFPIDQLNTKPLYPLYIKWGNGIIFKDSLILAQRSLDKWAKDLCVEHQKAVGFWDYEKIRDQHGEELTPEELEYIEHDVLAGVECIDATLEQLKKNIGSIPYTATGIPRGECREISRTNRGRDWFQRIQPEEYSLQQKQEVCFHGGFTHNNRYFTGVTTNAECLDFSSSYPYEMLQKFPSEKFWKMSGKVDPMTILKNKENYAFLFTVSARKVDLLNLRDPMPSLLYSLKFQSLNAVVDGGRILRADWIECEMNETDFDLFVNQYTWEKGSLIVEDVYCAEKDYLPRWFTDYVFERYRLKSKLKHVDPVLYAIEKAKLNALFGMSAQRPVKMKVIEDYETGEYHIDYDFNADEEYEKWRTGRSAFLPYCIGVWVTAYAMRDLFRLGSCVAKDGDWLYSDTDSVYATKFDQEKVEKFNRERAAFLTERGYGPFEIDGEVFTLGESALDGTYAQFKALHSKCYVTRDMSGKLKITVAGVPKKGVEALEDDIDAFKIGFRFPGEISGKLQHEHHFIDAIYMDERGNLTGDSINLMPCDYIIKPEDDFDIEDIVGEEVLSQSYEE